MKCQVCKDNDAINGSIVCSEKCNKIRLKINYISKKFTPTPGCNNCLGDLHQGCTAKCKDEFKRSKELVEELYDLIRIK